MANWQRATWGLVSCMLAVCISALLWMFWQAFSNLEVQLQARGADASEHFLVAGTGVLAGLLFKVLGIFIGASLSLGGLALSFFSARSASVFGDDASKLKLSSSSPGIFAVVAGTVIIVVTIKHNVESSIHQDAAVPEARVSFDMVPLQVAAIASAPSVASAPPSKPLIRPLAKGIASEPLASARVSPCDQAINAYDLVLARSEAKDVCGARSAARSFVESANRAMQNQACTMFLRAAPKHLNDALDRAETGTAECDGMRALRIAVSTPLGAASTSFKSYDRATSSSVMR